MIITSPTMGATVTAMPSANDPSAVVTDIEFVVMNFTLMPPASCMGRPACGHVHLYIDDQACTPQGAPYDNSGQSSPLEAILNSCASVKGPHSVRLELHNDDHTPVLEADGMTIVSATVDVTVD